MYEDHPVFKPLENPQTKIWRFMSVEKFMSLLRTGSLHFAKVTSFEDPYEGSVAEFNQINAREVYEEVRDKFSSNEQFKKFLKNKKNIKNAIYEKLKEQLLVNCWHINDHESSSMWKLYTSNFSGIAIQSTYEKIKQSLQNNLNDKVWIGKVNYSDYSKE